MVEFNLRGLTGEPRRRNRKTLVVLPIGLVLLVSWGIYGCGKQTSELKSEAKTVKSQKKTPSVSETAPKESQEAEWRPVQTFTGTGMQNTPEFTVTGDAWRVTVTGAGANPQAVFTGYLRLQGDDPEAPQDHGQIAGRGTEPVVQNFSEAGTYFIHMHGDDVNWKIVVEERQLQRFRFDR